MVFKSIDVLRTFLKFALVSIFAFYCLIPYNKVPLAYADEKISYENIDSSLLDDTSDAPKDVLIQLQPLDLTGSSQLSRAAFIAQRQSKAVEAQQRIIDFLENQGIPKDQVQGFWIANVIHAHIPLSALKTISTFPEVKKISPNNSIKSDDAHKVSSRRSRSLDLHKEIEQNVQAISANRVWDELGITGKSVRIGMVDQYVDIDHPALLRHYVGYNESTGEIDRRYNKDFLMDGKQSQDVHGTHVAGILVGSELRAIEGEDVEVNRIGVAPGARFMAARAFREGVGGNNDTILKACEWLMAPDGDPNLAPRIVNHSWTDGSNTPDPWFDEMARTMRSAGILNIMSAGNNGAVKAPASSIDNPASSPLIFSVGATDNTGKLASFSRRGPSLQADAGIKPDIVAPGVQVRSSTIQNSYASWNGTSMAAPHVAGVAALMLEANPSLTVDQIEQILKDTAQAKTDTEYSQSPNDGYGYGVVDAYAAVSEALRLAQNKPETTAVSFSGAVFAEEAGTQTLENTLGKAEVSAGRIAFSHRPYEVLLRVEQPEKLAQATLSWMSHGAKEDIAFAPLKEGSVFYKATVPAEKVQEGTASWSVVLKSTTHEHYQTQDHTTDVVFAVLPGTFKTDLEFHAPGFACEGDFSWDVAHLQFDPKPTSGKHLIGLNLGGTHMGVQELSTMEFPRIDLRKVAPEDSVELVYQEWAQWNKAILQVQATTVPKEGKAQPLYSYDVSRNGEWVERRIDLSAYKGKVIDPFVFHLNRGASDGLGLFIDDVRVEINGKLSDNQDFSEKFNDYYRISTWNRVSQDKQDLPLSAKVELLGKQRIEYTRVDSGEFSFSPLEAGVYDVRVSAEGFESKDLRIDLSKAVHDYKIYLHKAVSDASDTAPTQNNPLLLEKYPGNKRFGYDHNNPLGGGIAIKRLGDGVGVKYHSSETYIPHQVQVYIAGDNPAYTDGKVKVYLKQFNALGRLIDIAKPQEAEVKTGKWNAIDFSQEQVECTGEIYVVVVPLRLVKEGPSIAQDRSVAPSTSAHNNAFYFNGDFLPLKAKGIFGMPLIRLEVRTQNSTDTMEKLSDPTFAPEIHREAHLDLLEGEGVLPQDIVTIGDWRISPSRAMIVGYNKLQELYEKTPVSERILEIPTEIGGVKITSIGASVFEYPKFGKGEITRVVIPEGITEINESAFANAGIKELVLPQTLENIYASAFKNQRLTQLSIPQHVRYIGDNAFENVGSVKQLILPDSIQELGREAFRGLGSLTTLKFPSNPQFESVSAACFKSAFSLEYVDIPASVKRIKASAFEDSSLVKVDLHEGLEYIDDSAFAGTETLKEVRLPDTLKEIGADAFKKGEIKTLVLPASLEKIYNGAFYKNRISDLIFPDSLKFVDWSAFEQNPLKRVRLNEAIMPRQGYKEKIGLDSEAFGNSLARLEVYREDQVNADLRKQIVDRGKPQADIVVLGEAEKQLSSIKAVCEGISFELLVPQAALSASPESYTLLVEPVNVPQSAQGVISKQNLHSNASVRLELLDSDKNPVSIAVPMRIRLTQVSGRSDGFSEDLAVVFVPYNDAEHGNILKHVSSAESIDIPVSRLGTLVLAYRNTAGAPAEVVPTEVDYGRTYRELFDSRPAQIDDAHEDIENDAHHEDMNAENNEGTEGEKSQAPTVGKTKHRLPRSGEGNILLISSLSLGTVFCLIGALRRKG